MQIFVKWHVKVFFKHPSQIYRIDIKLLSNTFNCYISVVIFLYKQLYFLHKTRTIKFRIFVNAVYNLLQNFHNFTQEFTFLYIGSKYKLYTISLK